MSNRPGTRLHSQLDNGVTSQESKIHGREPMRINPLDAEQRGIRDGDVVRVFNDRGAFLAGVRLSAALRRGVVQIATGAWYDVLDLADPKNLEIHGNPNAVTNEIGTSSLGQGPSANSCLVEAERYESDLPPLKVLSLPAIIERQEASSPARTPADLYARRFPVHRRSLSRPHLLANVARARGVRLDIAIAGRGRKMPRSSVRCARFSADRWSNSIGLSLEMSNLCKSYLSL